MGCSFSVEWADVADFVDRQRLSTIINHFIHKVYQRNSRVHPHTQRKAIQFLGTLPGTLAATSGYAGPVIVDAVLKGITEGDSENK
jgi:hypothetical protein